MPQMAPISWLLLFVSFSMIFMLFCINNYYSILPPSKTTSKLNSLKFNSMNWKW
uniref:ATP synthase F0 subunit 8 n=1 Tax=Apystomyia elinguis TaxID=797143 RepID=UPI0026E1E97B|nr:ATP synthase F0 subunit 8 [Apystomyia elinguis]WJW73492.1 ATP synthase F0 subunit 8 [Apystomyia elinguis]